jgi:ADP-heptose:LPS heptosyltransferase
MNNALIINLKRNGDIISMASNIRGLKKQYPHIKIELLVYEDFRPVATLLSDVSKVHSIPKKKLESLAKNRIFNPAHSLEELFQSLDSVIKTTWDCVINYSNDKVSSYLVSTMDTKYIFGTSITTLGTTATSNDWSTCLNEVVTSYRYTPFHLTDLFANIIGVEPSLEKDLLRRNPENDRLASENFEKFMKREGVTGTDTRFVGVQLTASSASKSVEPEVIIEVIDKILDVPKYIPILLVAPRREEIELAQKINSEFNNSLIVIEFDFKAAPSVISQLSAVITPDTVIKHFCDTLHVPVVEVSKGPAPFLLQGSAHPGSVIISKVGYARSFSTQKEDFQFLDFRFNANDIFDGLLFVLEGKDPNTIILSPNTTLYRTSRDNETITYDPIAGDIEFNFEVNRVFAQYYIHSWLKGSDIQLPEWLSLFPLEDFSQWLTKQKTSITNMVKDLLATIRNLHATKENLKKSHDFLHSLDKLLAHAEAQEASAIPVLNFRGQLENIQSQTVEKNLEEIETHLYQLKNNAQFLTNKVDDFVNSRRRKDKKSTPGEYVSMR